MERFVYKKLREFDMKKNYKLFRLFQKLANPKFNKRRSYKDVKIDLLTRKVKVRVFTPPKNNNRLIIYLHGGGWVAGSIDSYTNICYNLAYKTESTVMAISYRLAPEHPFPAGFNDCYDVIRLVYSSSEFLNLDPKNIVIMGDSAGGNLTAAVCQRAIDTRDFKVYKQILLYPALQSDYSKNTKYKSVIENGSSYIISRTQLCDFMEHYVKNKEDLDNKYVAPLLSNNLFRMPKTLIITADNDPLRDEGIEYAKKLKKFLVKVKHYNFYGAAHGFLTNILDESYTELAYEKIIEFLGD